MSWVHPRVCGGAAPTARRSATGSGPSPRVRGSRTHRAKVGDWIGSIPACAGEPRSSGRCRRRAGVHPRVCGGAEHFLPMFGRYDGPSPRVRGSRARRPEQPGRQRSIPACAGEPRVDPHSRLLRPVHPRVCGGASAFRLAAATADGPSPRVRGSRARRPEQPGRQRSIPACAGEPPHGRGCTFSGAVHPRVCGGAGPRRVLAGDQGGPSPRVRGSPGGGLRPFDTPRSIPACAGEPHQAGSPRATARVHPRVCGGAAWHDIANCFGQGPSPRVRGSRRSGARMGCWRRSIPACAGEPCCLRSFRRLSEVHPRVCGGAMLFALVPPPVRGPSPRVRGSPAGRG